MAKNMVRTAAAAFLLGLPIGSALAGPFTDGLNAAGTGNYAVALALWCPLADHGDAAARFKRGRLYLNGKGVEKNYEQAANGLRKAALQGHAGTQSNLGQRYFSGRGVPQNAIESCKWLELAAADANGGDKVRWEASKSRRCVAAKMSAEQVAAAQKLAREWPPTSSMPMAQDDS